MRLLLDTHALLWALLDPDRLDAAAAAAIADPANDVFVSAVSGWEAAIKQSLGKLVLPASAETWLLPAATTMGLDWIDVSAADAVAVRALPWHHRDPFDRLLVAQAQQRGFKLLTRDARLTAYGVPTLPA